MHDKEKQEARTTTNVERIYEVCTKYGRGVCEAAMENPITPAHTIEWIYNMHTNDVMAQLIIQHKNTPVAILKKMLGEYITSSGDSGTFKYPSWKAFKALLKLLERKGIITE